MLAIAARQSRLKIDYLFAPRIILAQPVTVDARLILPGTGEMPAAPGTPVVVELNALTVRFGAANEPLDRFTTISLGAVSAVAPFRGTRDAAKS